MKDYISKLEKYLCAKQFHSNNSTFFKTAGKLKIEKAIQEWANTQDDIVAVECVPVEEETKTAKKTVLRINIYARDGYYSITYDIISNPLNNLYIYTPDDSGYYLKCNRDGSWSFVDKNWITISDVYDMEVTMN